MSDQATLKDDFGYGALREPVKPGSPMEDITKQMAGGFTLEPEKPAPNFDWRINQAEPTAHDYTAGALKENADENKKGMKEFLNNVSFCLWFALRPWKLFGLLLELRKMMKKIMKYMDYWGEIPLEKELLELGFPKEKLEKHKQEMFRALEKYKKEGGKL